MGGMMAASISTVEKYSIKCKSLICREIDQRVAIVQHISSSGASLALLHNEGRLESLSSSSVKNLPKCCLMPSNGGKSPGRTSIEIKRRVFPPVRRKFPSELV